MDIQTNYYTYKHGFTVIAKVSSDFTLLCSNEKYYSLLNRQIYTHLLDGIEKSVIHGYHQFYKDSHIPPQLSVIKRIYTDYIAFKVHVLCDIYIDIDLMIPKLKRLIISPPTHSQILTPIQKQWLYKQNYKIQADTNAICAICHNELGTNKDKTILKLTCQHIFHTDCIQKWLFNHSSSCPTCRTILSK